ncbi:MAG: metallophosphoesterase family protein [Chloroflexales bacterium]|nr:metallophosphoesterase family protein [Chloroflexales bacterium]
MEKIAVLADIHGNLAALHALVEDLELWSPDLVVVAGDIINRGPQSGPCLDLVLTMAGEQGWRLIRGNHERYVLTYDQDRRRPGFPGTGLRYEISRILDWTHSQVADKIATVAALPEQLRIDLGGPELVVYHASVRHDRDGLTRDSPDDELRRQIDPAAAIFCVGHTHVPFTRRLGATLVVNTGSVGLPFDGDRRAAYARLTRAREGWRAQIVRLPYDVAATERAFHESGMLESVGAHGHLMLREIQTGRSLLFDFIPTYHDRIMAGAISVDEAVREFLSRFDRAA